jgi:Ca-activated chloride channel family protein
LSFANPFLLLGLLLLPPLVLLYRRLQARPTKYAVRYTNLDVLAGVVDSTPSWRRHVGLVLFLLALASLLVGFARPSVNRLADREEATIVLVIDVSGSMQAEDVDPTRLEAAQKVVREFMKGLPKRFQVGVVAFSETAEVAAPATEDRQLAIDAIDYLYPQRGTAIGDGIARGVEVARAADAGQRGTDRPAAILLLSDGSQTEGLLLPLEGAARAKSFKIPVYTIALGTPEGVVEFNRFGGTRIIPVPPDPATLRQIAATTGGRFYEAETVGDLREAYDKMGSLVSKVKRKQEVTYGFVAGGLVLLLAAAAIGVVTFPRLP